MPPKMKIKYVGVKISTTLRSVRRLKGDNLCNHCCSLFEILLSPLMQFYKVLLFHVKRFVNYHYIKICCFVFSLYSTTNIHHDTHKGPILIEIILYSLLPIIKNNNLIDFFLSYNKLQEKLFSFIAS